MGKRRKVWEIMVEEGIAESRARAEALVLAGVVRIDGKRVESASETVPEGVCPEIPGDEGVGRGGLKLAHALKIFQIPVEGRTCADVGACTGGFTEVLLNSGGAKVFSIDVSYGDLAWKLRQDSRVVVLERTNARLLENLPEPVSFICVDVSFISLKLILPQAVKWLADRSAADIVVLIKPQFEAQRDQIPKGGVIVDRAVHEAVLMDILGWAENAGLFVHGLTASPILGGKGNKEFLAWLKCSASEYDWRQAIVKVL